eukprot:1149389-Pelagomonas_calceolata.AAC.1
MPARVIKAGVGSTLADVDEAFLTQASEANDKQQTCEGDSQQTCEGPCWKFLYFKFIVPVPPSY